MYFFITKSPKSNMYFAALLGHLNSDLPHFQCETSSEPSSLKSLHIVVDQSLCPTLCLHEALAHQAPLSKGFFQARKLEWVAFLSPGNLPGPGIKPEFPTLAGGFLNTEPPGKPHLYIYSTYSNRIKSLEK